MNLPVAQAASLPYRRLPVGGRWDQTQAPRPANRQQVGNLRNSRQGSLRHGPNRDSWFQCVRKTEWRLSLSLVVRNNACR